MARSDVDYWLDLAKYDLGAARSMLRAKYRLYVGFLCHLAMEKTLKAYWVHVNKTTPPRTHALSILAQRSGILAELEERDISVLDFLEPLNIEARYPTEKKRLLRIMTLSKCRWLLEETQRLHQWISAKLSAK
jgi:HEPN domain-containing protein